MLQQNGLERGVSIEEQGEDDAANEVVMAIDMIQRETVGCCYYVAMEEKLYLLPDMKFGGLEVIDSVKLHAQPTVILLSTRVDESVDEQLDPHYRNRETTINGMLQVSGASTVLMAALDQFTLPYIIELRPISEFSYEGGKSRLMDLDLRSENQMRFIVPGDDDRYLRDVSRVKPGFTSQQEAFLRMSTKIDFENRISVGCAGAVLAYLRRRRNTQFLSDDVDMQAAFRIASIEMFALDGVM